METINIETKKQSWMRFLNDCYSGLPRMKSQLEPSELIDKEYGCEIRIPIRKEQEEFFDLGFGKALVERLMKLKSIVKLFQSEYPGLEELSFSLQMEDGTIVPINENSYGANIVDEQEEEDSVEFINTLTIDDGLPNDEHTQVVTELAKALCSDDYETIKTLVNDDVRMIAYRKRTVYGRDAFVEYWKWLSDLLKTDHKVTDYHLKYNEFCEHTVISVRQRDYFNKSTEEAYIFLYLKEGRISCGVFTSKQQQPITIRYYDLDRPALNYEDVMRDKAEALTPEPNRMPCLHCGRLSEDLEWYKLYVDSGPFGHIGQVSVCPHCKKQVEFYPEIFLRQS